MMNDTFGINSRCYQICRLQGRSILIFVRRVCTQRYQIKSLSASNRKSATCLAGESEGAACGIYITRVEPTQPMKDFAKQQGQFKPEHFTPFDRLQIVTVQEIFDGARMNLPLMEEVTKRA